MEGPEVLGGGAEWGWYLSSPRGTVVGASLSIRATGHDDEGHHPPLTDVPEQTGAGYQALCARNPPPGREPWGPLA